MFKLLRCARQLGVMVCIYMTSLSATAIEFDFSGYASLVAGRVLQGSDTPGKQINYGEFNCPCFIADYVNAGVYEDDGRDFEPDSRLGLQLKTQFTDSFAFTVQAAANGGNNFKPHIPYAYFRYDIDDQWSIDIGRKRLPLFFYSDFIDVGHAYPWIRVPGDLYGWPITSYNGISSTYSGDLGDGSYAVTLWLGEEKDEDNREYDKLYYFSKVFIEWTEMKGVSFEYNYDWLTLRAVHMHNKIDSHADYGEPGVTADEVLNNDHNQDFFGLALNIDYNDWQLRTEANQFEIPKGDFDSRAVLVSLGYRLGQFTPTFSWTRYRDYEKGFGHSRSNVSSFVLRWDFHRQAAFKFQYDEVDEGTDWDFIGDSRVIATGVDYVF